MEEKLVCQYPAYQKSAHAGRMPVMYVSERCLTVSVNYLNLDTT